MQMPDYNDIMSASEFLLFLDQIIRYIGMHNVMLPKICRCTQKTASKSDCY